MRHWLGRAACLAAVAIVLPVASAAAPPLLRLATTTSTDDSGLLKAILPAFEGDVRLPRRGRRRRNRPGA